MTRSNRSRTMAALTAVCAVPMLVAACSGGSSGGASGGSTGGAPAAEDKAKEFSVLLTTENSQTPAMFKSLAAGACKAENDALPLKIDQTPSANMQQKIQLLAGQNALPVMFAAGTSLIAPGGDLDKAGQVLNIKDAAHPARRLRPGHPVGGRCRRQALQRRVPDCPPAVQHRGTLLQQEDPRRPRHRRAHDGRRADRRGATSSRRPASRRSPPRARPAGPSAAGSARCSSAPSARTPWRTSRPARPS